MCISYILEHSNTLRYFNSVFQLSNLKKEISRSYPNILNLLINRQINF